MCVYDSKIVNSQIFPIYVNLMTNINNKNIMNIDNFLFQKICKSKYKAIVVSKYNEIVSGRGISNSCSANRGTGKHGIGRNSPKKNNGNNFNNVST